MKLSKLYYNTYIGTAVNVLWMGVVFVSLNTPLFTSVVRNMVYAVCMMIFSYKLHKSYELADEYTIFDDSVGGTLCELTTISHLVLTGINLIARVMAVILMASGKGHTLNIIVMLLSLVVLGVVVVFKGEGYSIDKKEVRRAIETWLEEYFGLPAGEIARVMGESDAESKSRR